MEFPLLVRLLRAASTLCVGYGDLLPGEVKNKRLLGMASGMLERSQFCGNRKACVRWLRCPSLGDETALELNCDFLFWSALLPGPVDPVYAVDITWDWCRQ